ncbi:hypothetical protein DPMN_108028 [Dreissena polymorpha]|uniref:Uncharacterized protein n=1 Tax=Dreissena polymorpha TaxID=45954 RepID=A0A9D4K7S2_DREPO|nr:hypothetical protein DPMN_108028 [Dreissena polymorpha]
MITPTSRCICQSASGDVDLQVGMSICRWECRSAGGNVDLHVGMPINKSESQSADGDANQQVEMPISRFECQSDFYVSKSPYLFGIFFSVPVALPTSFISVCCDKCTAFHFFSAA